MKDKIVIVGATAVGIYDLRVTPFGTVFPGVEIHANVVGSILIKKDNKPIAKLTAISKFGKKRIAGLIENVHIVVASPPVRQRDLNCLPWVAPLNTLRCD